MALSKDIVIEENIVVNYWRISDIRFDYFQKTITVVLAGYPSVKERQDGAPPVNGQTLKITDECFVESATREDVYKYIKSLPGWADVSDI